MRLRLALPILTALFASTAARAELALSTTPPTVTLSGDLGGLVSGGPWTSESLKGKVFAFFYVDPDEKNINQEMEDSLKAQEFAADKFASVAVINMDATWLPNAAIASALESKQKEHPKTIYVKDMEKELVKKWKLKDDGYETVVFDKSGKVVFDQIGVLAKADIDKLIATIKKSIAE